MNTLSNAARSMIESALERIRAHGGVQSNEDLAGALRQREAIETEIGQLETLINAAHKIAKMKYPSVEHILRERGFGYEADRLVELVAAIESIPIENHMKSA